MILKLKPRRGSLIGDYASIAVVAEPGERRWCVDKIRCETFAGGDVAWGDALSLVGGEARMVKTVVDVQRSLADSAAIEQVLEQMVPEYEHELGAASAGIASKLPPEDQTPRLARAWTWG
jgi:hypothetical protein